MIRFVNGLGRSSAIALQSQSSKVFLPASSSSENIPEGILVSQTAASVENFAVLYARVIFRISFMKCVFVEIFARIQRARP